MSDAIAWLGVALIVASIAGCIVGTHWVEVEREKALTPQQICVQKAWTQADRIECLKTK